MFPASPSAREPLEGAVADVAVAEPDQHRAPRRRGLVAALQLLAGLDQRQRLRGVRRPAPPASRSPAPRARRPSASGGRRRTGCTASARALGAEIHQPAAAVVRTCANRKPRPSPRSGIVGAELVAMIAQRERRFEAAGQRLEAAEVPDPVGVAQPVEADLRGGARRCGNAGYAAGNRRRATGS